MNSIQITSSKVPDKIFCPTSKSYANRALIIAALKRSSIEVKDLPEATDVQDLILNLEELGIDLIRAESNIRIINSFPDCEIKREDPVYLSGSEGGTTIRFLIPLLALGSNTYYIKLQGGLKNRPMQQLIDLINELGGSCSKIDDNLIIKGPIQLRTKVEVDCSQSTQFASAFILLSSVYDVVLELKHLKSSKKYLEMSYEVVSRLASSNEYIVPPDMSGLGYLMVIAATKQDILIRNVYEIDLLQADSYIFELFDHIGINYSFRNNGLLVTRSSKFSGFKLDCDLCLDLVPTLMFLACFASTPSVFSNLENLKYKESDRLEEMKKILSYFSANFEHLADKDQLIIRPSILSYDKSTCLATAFDHRMVMVGSLFLKVLQGGSIFPKDAVKKSFPNFFDLIS